MLQRALAASLRMAGASADLPPGRQPWAAQLAVELAAVSMPVDQQGPRPLLFSLWAQLDRSRCPSRKGRVLGTGHGPGAPGRGGGAHNNTYQSQLNKLLLNMHHINKAFIWCMST